MSFLVDLVERKRWFTWWSNQLPGPSIFPKKDAYEERVGLTGFSFPRKGWFGLVVGWFGGDASQSKSPTKGSCF